MASAHFLQLAVFAYGRRTHMDKFGKLTPEIYWYWANGILLGVSSDNNDYILEII